MSQGLKVVLTIVAIVAFVGFLFKASFGDRYRVEVCMEFHGERQCKTARAKTHEDAVRTALSNACADLTSGMTNVLACEQSKPVSLKDLP